MKSKFQAAEIAMAAGVDMWIANGSEADAIRRTMNNQIGTHFSTRIIGQRAALAAAYSQMV